MEYAHAAQQRSATSGAGVSKAATAGAQIAETAHGSATNGAWTTVAPALLKKLNADQLRAVLCPMARPLLVAAGPGSGKTSAMIARTACFWTRCGFLNAMSLIRDLAVQQIEHEYRLIGLHATSPYRHLIVLKHCMRSLHDLSQLVIALQHVSSGHSMSRNAHLLLQGLPPEALLVVTFTTDAAGEFKKRLQDTFGPRVAASTVCTFHSLSITLLKQH